MYGIAIQALEQTTKIRNQIVRLTMLIEEPQAPTTRNKIKVPPTRMIGMPIQ